MFKWLRAIYRYFFYVPPAPKPLSSEELARARTILPADPSRKSLHIMHDATEMKVVRVTLTLDVAVTDDNLPLALDNLQAALDQHGYKIARLVVE